MCNRIILLYEINDVAERVGLSPTTIRDYLRPGRSDLVRGRDFIIWRFAGNRRRTVVTDRGLERLALRQYSTRAWRTTDEIRKDPGHPRLRLNGTRQSRVAHLRHVLYDALWRYQETPCAVPNCPCIIHKLGVPQADVVQVIMKRDGWVDAFGKFHRFNDYQRRDTDK